MANWGRHGCSGGERGTKEREKEIEIMKKGVVHSLKNLCKIFFLLAGGQMPQGLGGDVF